RSSRQRLVRGYLLRQRAISARLNFQLRHRAFVQRAQFVTKRRVGITLRDLASRGGTDSGSEVGLDFLIKKKGKLPRGVIASFGIDGRRFHKSGLRFARRFNQRGRCPLRFANRIGLASAYGSGGADLRQLLQVWWQRNGGRSDRLVLSRGGTTGATE